jgi:hypothetical protein
MIRFVVALLLGCGAQSSPQSVTVATPSSSTTATTPPVVPIRAWSGEAFISAGCARSGDSGLDCTSAKIEGVGACRGPLYLVPAKVDPAAVFAQCHADTAKVPRGLYTSGCKLTSSVIYFVVIDGAIKRVGSAKELAAAFAPVTSGEEAVAFAELETGDDAFDKERKADDGKAMLTTATRDADGWTFDLFRYTSCGCDHPIVRVSYHVARDGTVTEKARARALENADQSGMCKD